MIVRRYGIPLIAFLAGSVLMVGIYFGIVVWAQGWEDARSLFSSNRWYLFSIWMSFGIQAALYAILRFRLYVPTTSTGHTGLLMGTGGGTSVTAMVACCLHHMTDVLPILGLSTAATFLTSYQRPFMLAGLSLNLIGITVMLRVLYREHQKLRPTHKIQPILETE